MLKDYFSFAIGNLFHRKLRSWLTMIGIFIGIAAVVALISLGEGLKNAIDNQFSLLGADKLFISVKGGTGGFPGATPTVLTTADLDKVRHINGVEGATDYLFKTEKVSWKDKPYFTAVISIPLDRNRYIFDEVFFTKIIQGRALRPGDASKVVIGHDLSTDKIDHPLSVGNTIFIRDQPFDVVGIYEGSGDPTNDKSIYIPEATYRQVFDVPDRVDMILAKTSAGEDPIAVADRVTRNLRSFRHLAAGKEDFTIQTPTDILATLNTVLNIVIGVLVGIAAISLIVGGVGIMNTMYTAVLERTKEIGIMKSIGGQNKDIFLIFLIESGLLGALGGLIGVILGMAASKIVEYIAALYLGPNYLAVVFPLPLMLGALLFSFVVGAVSGVVPAYQASRMKPVDALQYGS